MQFKRPMRNLFPKERKNYHYFYSCVTFAPERDCSKLSTDCFELYTLKHNNMMNGKVTSFARICWNKMSRSKLVSDLKLNLLFSYCVKAFSPWKN